MTETVTACPECDSSQIESRVGDDHRVRFYCRECKRGFREPVERSPNGPERDPRKGLARQLADANPDEVGL